MDSDLGTILDLSCNSCFSKKKKKATQFKNIFKVSFDKHEITS